MGLGSAGRFALKFGVWRNCSSHRRNLPRLHCAPEDFSRPRPRRARMINLSPRGTDAFVVLDELTVAYLDRTGSGNETAAHLKADGRLTLMFCAFEDPPIFYGSMAAARSCGAGATPIAAPRARVRGRRTARRAPDRCSACRSRSDVLRLRDAPVRIPRRAPVAGQLGPFQGRRRASSLLAREERLQHRRPADRIGRRGLASPALKVGKDGMLDVVAAPSVVADYAIVKRAIEFVSSRRRNYQYPFTGGDTIQQPGPRTACLATARELNHSGGRPRRCLLFHITITLDRCITTIRTPLVGSRHRLATALAYLLFHPVLH